MYLGTDEDGEIGALFQRRAPRPAAVVTQKDMLEHGLMIAPTPDKNRAAVRTYVTLYDAENLTL